jgi:hypothetical protein
VSAVTTTGAIRLTLPGPHSALADAIALVCADLRLMDYRRAEVPDHALVDVARDDISDDEIRDALADGEITPATAAAYRLVWDAPSADLNAALAAAAR